MFQKKYLKYKCKTLMKIMTVKIREMHGQEGINPLATGSSVQHGLLLTGRCR